MENSLQILFEEEKEQINITFGENSRFMANPLEEDVASPQHAMDGKIFKMN